jgi:hypothetical protein
MQEDFPAAKAIFDDGASHAQCVATTQCDITKEETPGLA